MEKQKTPVQVYLLVAMYVLFGLVFAAAYLATVTDLCVGLLGYTFGTFLSFLPLMVLGPLVMSGITYRLYIKRLAPDMGFRDSLKKHIAVHRPFSILPLAGIAILHFVILAAVYKRAEAFSYEIAGPVLMIVSAGFGAFMLVRAFEGAKALHALMSSPA